MSKRVSNKKGRQRVAPARSYRTQTRGRVKRRRARLIAEARARVEAVRNAES